MAVRNITKQLAGLEDLALRGIGAISEDQIRNGNLVPITKLDIPAIVDTIDDLINVDPNKFRSAIVIEKGRGGIFNYDATQSDVNDGGIIFNGWVRNYDGAINVKWFGAKGDYDEDTMTGTDNTEAFKKAMEVVVKINGYSYFNEANEVYKRALSYTTKLIVPSGVYGIKDTLFLDNGIVIEGEGSVNTKIILFNDFSSSLTRTLFLPEGNITAQFVMDSRRPNASEWSWAISIKGIGFLNSIIAQPSQGGINLTNTHKWKLEDLSFSNMAYGLYLYGAWSGNANHITTTFCNSVGIYCDFIDGSIDTEIGSNQECNAIEFTNIFIDKANGKGFRFDRCNGIGINGGAIQRQGEDGIYSDGINKGLRINTYFEGNARKLDPSDELYDSAATLDDYYDINIGSSTDYLVDIDSIFFSKLHRCIGINYGKHINIKAFNFLNTVDAKAIVQIKQADVKGVVIEQLGYDPNTTPTEGIIQNTAASKTVFSSPLKASIFTYGNDILRVDHINIAYAAQLYLDKNLLCNSGVLTIPMVIEGMGNYLTSQVADSPALIINASDTIINNINFKSNTSSVSGTILEIDTAQDVTINNCKFVGRSTIGAVHVKSGSPYTKILECKFELGVGDRAIKISSSYASVENCRTTSSAVIYTEASYGQFNNLLPNNFTITDATSGKVQFINGKMFRTSTPTHTPIFDYDKFVYNSNMSAGGSSMWVWADDEWKTAGTIAE